MFSKELYELDRNTVQYMIDELKEENQRQKEENQRQKEKIEQMEAELREALKKLEEYKR